MARTRKLLLLSLIAAVTLSAGVAYGMGNMRIAALQVGLVRQGLYAGPVDGLAGPATKKAVLALQRRAGLPAKRVAGRNARRRLRSLGPLGAR